MKKPFIIVFVVASAIVLTTVFFKPETTTSLPMEEDSVGTSMSAAKQVSDIPL